MNVRTIRDAGHDIPVMTQCTSESKTTDSQVVVINGFVGGTLAHSFARHLIDAGSPQISTYEEPYVGRGSYAESYRAEIFDKVVRNIGRQVLVLAHSRGVVAWANTSEQLTDDELVTGFISVTPIGVSELPYVSHYERYKRLTSEIIRPCFNSWESAKMSARVAGHIIQRFSHPILAFDEVDRTLLTDATDAMIATSQTVPTTMITGVHDRLIPPEEVAARLNPSTGYTGSHREIPATHLGAFADSRHSQVIADAINALDRQH
jgi:pimeloyl-ACP methyl ester carboxylesterase